MNEEIENIIKMKKKDNKEKNALMSAPFPLGEGRGEASGSCLYVSPAIKIIHVERESMMTTMSMVISTDPAGTTGNSKPGDPWGDVWGEPVPPTNTDDFSKQPASNPDGTW